jgi:SAM-dependent methyltransferase
MTTRPASRYVFDTADPVEQERLRAHGELWDPFTFRKLAETGVGDGWRCLEIGAGIGSVAAWLVGRVGSRGHVVATDVEPRWLEPLAAANLEVRHHNVVVDPLEEGGYDLIHARLVLEHLPQRRAVVAKLVTALRPGGWLVVEDYDLRTLPMSDPPFPAWDTVTRALTDALDVAGIDPRCGAGLLRLLRASGLADVSAEGFLRPLGVADHAAVLRPVLERLQASILATGAIRADQLEQVIDAFDRPDGDEPCAYTPILVSAAGRRPEPSPTTG